MYVTQYGHRTIPDCKCDEYLQICWPTHKPIYQRAVLWVHFSEVTIAKAKERKSKNSFFGMIGGSAKAKGTETESVKYKHKFGKLWRDITVAQFESDSNSVFDSDSSTAK